MVIAVVVIYGSVKAVALVRGPVPASGALALFLTIWPGVRTEPFTLRQRPDPDGLRVVAQGAATALLGLACWVALAHAAAGLPRGVVGWLGVFVVLLTLHLGLSDVVSGGLRWAGYPVRRLFRAYWLVRLVIDWFWFGHRIWPPGRRFVIAHIGLEALFAFLAAVYLAVAVWPARR